MSSTPPTPTPPPNAAAPPPAPPSPPAQPPPVTFSLGRWFQNLNPIAKGAFLAIPLLVLVAWYIFSGRVTTDDAQVDCHITAVAPQVPGYVVNLYINDNTPVKEGDVLVQIDPREYKQKWRRPKPIWISRRRKQIPRKSKSV